MLLLLVLCVHFCTVIHTVLCLQLSKLNVNLSGKEVSIWIIVGVIRALWSIYVYTSFLFAFEAWVCDLILSIGHCLSFSFFLLLAKAPTR